MGYLSVTVLIALVGGVSLAALAGARRTQSSFPTYLAYTNPSTVELFTSYLAPNLGENSGYRAGLNAEIAHLQLVEARRDLGCFRRQRRSQSRTRCAPRRCLPGRTATSRSSDGEFTQVDRVSVVAGHLFQPNSHDEAVMNARSSQGDGCAHRFDATVLYSDADLEYLEFAEAGRGRRFGSSVRSSPAGT